MSQFKAKHIHNAIFARKMKSVHDEDLRMINYHGFSYKAVLKYDRVWSVTDNLGKLLVFKRFDTSELYTKELLHMNMLSGDKISLPVVYSSTHCDGGVIVTQSM